MPAKFIPGRVLSDLDQVIAAWEANPTFGMGDEATLAKVKATRAELAQCDVDITALTTQLTGLRNDEGTYAAKGADLVTRIRSALRGVYGPESTQYEQAGGTRRSERKRPSRSGKPPA
jgi:hypothetical protein